MFNVLMKLFYQVFLKLIVYRHTSFVQMGNFSLVYIIVTNILSLLILYTQFYIYV